MRLALGALVAALLVVPAAAGKAGCGRRRRPWPRPACQLGHRADRPGLGRAEDQGRRGHERRRQRPARGGAQPPGETAAAHAARASRCQGRHDSDDDDGHEHGERRPCADREPCGRGAVPPDPRGRLHRSLGSRHACAPSRAAPRLDGRRLRRQQARCARRAAGSPHGARLPGPRTAGALRLHRLQLGRRPRDPGRDGVHDEPDRGSPPGHCGISAPSGARALPRDVALSRPSRLPSAGELA